MDSVPIHILASAVVDLSLAILCGLLLARRWGLLAPFPLPSLAVPAATLAIGIFLQLLALTAAFTGKASLGDVVHMLPDILQTHPGLVLGLALGAALLLLGSAFTPSAGAQTTLQTTAQTAALLLCLCLRAGSGHAATEHLFSLSQAAQFLHLTAMAVWSGGVLIAGFLILPRLAATHASTHASAAAFAKVLASLSSSSTRALAIVVLSGMFRGYTSLAGDYRSLIRTAWGLTLLAKLAAVAIALTLGALNRLQLRNPAWSPAQRIRSTRILRAEAFAMIVILVLSATLANLPPPGD